MGNTCDPVGSAFRTAVYHHVCGEYCLGRISSHTRAATTAIHKNHAREQLRW